MTSESGHTSRRTDRETLDIFLMATALLNRRLVAGLRAAGVDAIGLSGVDAGVLRARRKGAIRVIENGKRLVLRDEWTGTPTDARGDFLRDLIARGLTPVIAPVAVSDAGEPLNVDGDRAAACLAAAMGARRLVFLTNVPGVLADPDDERSLITRADADDMEALRRAAAGRMAKKVLGAEEACQGGVHQVVIADARREHPILDAFAGVGTVIDRRTRDASESEAMTS